MSERIVNEAGKRYGKLIVLRECGRDKCGRVKWLCRCDCGNLKSVIGSCLRREETTSCGCYVSEKRSKEYIGKRFGRLVVIKRISSPKNGKSRWLCKCDCGNEKEVYGGYLREGEVKSCGCIVAESTKKYGERAFGRLYKSYKNGAIARGHEFSLSPDEFREITQKDCFYCGKPPSTHYKPVGNGEYIYNGIDRVDNKSGYTICNSVPCCPRCNFSKRSLSIEDFRDLIISVYKHWISQ